MRRIARDTAEVARRWLMMRLWISSSIRRSFSVSSSVSLKTGMPVHGQHLGDLLLADAQTRTSISPAFHRCSRRCLSSWA